MNYTAQKCVESNNVRSIKIALTGTMEHAMDYRGVIFGKILYESEMGTRDWHRRWGNVEGVKQERTTDIGRLEWFLWYCSTNRAPEYV